MKKTAIIALAAALFAPAVLAADFSAAKSACAAAIAEKAGKPNDVAQSKLVKGRERGAALVTVEVLFADGAKATGDCKVRRGVVEELSLAEQAR